MDLGHQCEFRHDHCWDKYSAMLSCSFCRAFLVSFLWRQNGGYEHFHCGELWLLCRFTSGHIMEKNTTNIMKDIRASFGKAPLRRTNLLKRETSAWDKDTPWNGRSSTRRETCAAAAESVVWLLMKLTRKQAVELQALRLMTCIHMKKDLNIKPFSSVTVNELTDMQLV